MVARYTHTCYTGAIMRPMSLLLPATPRWLTGLLLTTLIAVAPSAPHAPQRERRLNPPSITDSSAIAALRAYATAFASGRYDTMWRLLAPATREGWGAQEDYAAYYRRKFAPVRLRGVTLGAPQDAGPIVRIPLTLDLAWRHGGQPDVLTLLRNLNTTLVRTPAGWRVAQGGPLDLEAPIIPPPVPPASIIRVPILMYHHISDIPPLAYSQVDLTVTAHGFAAQLAYLSTHAYHAIRLVDLFNTLYYGRPLPPRPVILTFDDGYADNYTNAFPLLRRYHMMGAFYIITGLVGTTLGVNTYVTWPQVEAMAMAGMDMESHTVSHPDLGLLDAERDAYELRFSRAMLAGRIHRAVQFMAYPSGAPFRSGTIEARARIQAILTRYGYIGAVLDPVTPSTQQDARTPYELPRVRIARTTTLAQFAALLRL
jgi:peptidoglycan/xylan/chitin deacetylase (PgdA/CDA1 family)